MHQRGGVDFVQNTFQSLVVSLVQRAIPRDKTVSGDIRQEWQILLGYGAHRTEEVTNNQIDRHVIEDGKRMVDASFGNIDMVSLVPSPFQSLSL